MFFEVTIVFWGGVTLVCFLFLFFSNSSVCVF